MEKEHKNCKVKTHVEKQGSNLGIHNSMVSLDEALIREDP